VGTPTTIPNKVDQSGLVTIDPADFYPEGDRVEFDIKPHLFEGLILREKDFREFVKSNDWTEYRDKFVAVCCSADAIIPVWAYMLLASALQPYAREIHFGTLQEMESRLFTKRLELLNPEVYRDQRIVIKGCGDVPVPVSAYVELTRILKPVARSIMYGEPCSTVPVYKR
jgi:hypothetical protein